MGGWRPTHLKADEPLLPGVEAREVDLSQGFMAQLEVDPVWGDRELKGHSLMSFCHGGLLLLGVTVEEMTYT